MRPNGHAAIPATERIRQKTARSVAQTSAHGPGAVRERLEALDSEWSVERTSQLLWALTALAGLTLGGVNRQRWLAVSGASAGFLIQAAIFGWSPAHPILRRLGFRTPREIDQERETLLSAL